MRQGGRRGTAGALLVDLALVAVCVAVLGLLVGVLWPQLVDPALSVRTSEGISTSEVQLGKVFSADGWFVVLGFVGSALLGGALMLRRRGHEVVVVLLLLGGTYLAARFIAEPLGESLGPPDPVTVLTDAEVGDTAPVQLRVTSRADRLAWPLGGAVGSLLVLLAVTRLEHDRHRSATDPQDGVVTPTSGSTAE